MCGIIGYIGHKRRRRVLVHELKCVRRRSQDSARRLQQPVRPPAQPRADVTVD